MAGMASIQFGFTGVNPRIAILLNGYIYISPVSFVGMIWLFYVLAQQTKVEEMIETIEEIKYHNLEENP